MRLARHSLMAMTTLAFFAMAGGEAALAGNNTQKAMQAASQALKAKKYDAAVELYNSVVVEPELSPEELAAVLLNRALAQQYLQKNAAAIADYTSALTIKVMAPALRATALYNRGLSYHKTGNLPFAIEDYTAALVLKPDLAHAFLSRGNALRDSGQLLFALSDFERALQYNHPDPGRVHYAASQTYARLHRPRDMQRELKAVLAINPQHQAAKRELALLLTNEAASVDQTDTLTTSSTAPVASTVLHKPAAPDAVLPSPTLMQSPQVDTNDAIANQTSAKIKERLPAETPPPQVTLPVAGTETKPLPEEIQTATAEEVAAVVEANVTLDNTDPTEWVVQFASASSEEGAWSTWAKMQKRYKSLRDVAPKVTRADLGKKGIVYRIRQTGFQDATAANKTCSAFKRQGIACYVSRSGS